jgi:hypothetical protein
MPGIVLLRKQIVKLFRRMFPRCVRFKPHTPLGFQPFLHREQASNVNILSSHTPAIQQRFLPPSGGPYFLPLTDGHFGLYSGVYLVAGFWLEGAQDSEEAELLSPRRSLLLPLEFVVPACKEFFSSTRLLNAHSTRRIRLCSGYASG